MTKYIDTKKVIGNIVGTSQKLRVHKEGSPLNLDVIINWLT